MRDAVVRAPVAGILSETADPVAACPRAGVMTGDGGDVEQAVVPAGGDGSVDPEAVEFVRFCYRRRGLGWPELYDEMCAAAARGAWRGMGYDQLAKLGLRFGLGELGALSALARHVVDEERIGAGLPSARARAR